MEYGASTATLSKKLSNVYGFSGKSAYDGIFAAPTKFKATSFSSRVDDYCEIFGVSRGSSIPILEVPELNERKFSDDIRPTKLDYSKVFRGFENLDTAISYEELFAEPKREDSSLQEEWSPAKRGISNSGKNLSCIAESPVVSHEASYQSFDGAKIISVSSQGGKNGSNGMTHIAQIHAVSGYTCLFDEITPLKNDADKTLPSVVANTYPCNSVKERLKESRHCTTAITSPPPDDASKQSSEDRVEVQNRSHRRRSDSVHLSDASDISHGSHYMNMFPSENPACYSDNLREDSERSMETNGKVSNRNSSELPGGDYSLPSFDDLVDSNSEVAASVAALWKAIEEAQERLKVAKESMKRKKEGFRDHVKLRFDYDSKSPREEGKMAYKGNRKKETKTREVFEEVDVSGQVPTGIGNEMMRPDQVTSDLGVKEIRFDAKEAVGETQKESEVEETEEEVEWEEVNQYIDDVNTSNYKVTRLEFAQARMLYNVDNNVCNGEKMYSKAFDKSEESDETLTVDPWGQENEKRVYAGKGACGGEEILEEIKSVQEVLAYEGKEERLTVLKNQEETEKKIEASPELEDCERRLNEFQEPKENEKEIAHDQGKIEKKFEVSSKQEECERYLRVHYEPVEDEKEVPPELNQIEGKVEVFCDLKECELRKYQEPIGNEKTFQPQDLDLKNIERQIDNQAWVEHDKIGQEACEENEKELNHVNEEEGIGKRFNNVYQQEIIDKKVDSFHEEEELEKRLTEDDKSDGNMKLQEAEEDVEVLEGASYWMLENAWGEEETCEWKETNRTQKARDENMEVFPETTKCEEENNKETDNISEPDKNVNLSENQEADLCMDSDRNLEVCSDVPAHEEQDTIVGVILTSFQPKKNKKGPEAVGNMKLQEAKEDAEVLEGASYWMLENKCGEEENARVETNRTHTARDENVEVTQEATKCEEEKDILETVCLAQGVPRLDVAMDNTGDTIETLAFDKTGIDLGEDDLNVGKVRDHCVREAEIVCNLGMHVEELIPGYVEMNKDAKEAEVSLNDGMDQNYNEFSCEEILTSDRNNVEAVSQLTSMSERESKAFIYEDTKTNQATEKIKENHQTTLPVDKEKEYNSSQKLEVEKEYIRKIDEEKEQEREKEKLAVERAICEARERAFAEAQERAAVDRTTAGACRRMMADTRDRLGKISSLTSDKAPDEKASVEAKLKAERAAVERATTEARLRALEKAMSEKASFEARNKVDKFVAEKSSGAFRDNGLRQNFSYDAQDKGSWSSSCSIYRKSFDRGVDGANVESAQRCKARSERHQRIVECAEKALAEKNLRDLHAQKEQEERNRLAEVLYADVKRWSSGKEGNLRALLSTLHYVLGPDSGWQPIPLTDIVTTAAVKKAYRKATLCVHPDKLQQRGASIQQKYTCEKVFDLIKDAWNKFNKDER